MFIVEICPREPRASICSQDGESVASHPDIAACRKAGDCKSACQHVLDHLGVEFRIVAQNAAGEYENRLATSNEITATARAVYYDSDSDFSDIYIAKLYLVWQAAHDCENELEVED